MKVLLTAIWWWLSFRKLLHTLKCISPIESAITTSIYVPTYGTLSPSPSNVIQLSEINAKTFGNHVNTEKRSTKTFVCVCVWIEWRNEICMKWFRTPFIKEYTQLGAITLLATPIFCKFASYNELQHRLLFFFHITEIWNALFILRYYKK